VALALVGLAIILALTLLPTRSTSLSNAPPNWCIWCGESGTTNLILNIMLFVPLGAGLAWLGWTKPTVVISGLGLSLLIETLQMTVLRGRFAALGDVLANTAGVWLGYRLAAALLSRSVLSRAAYRARGVLAWLLAVAVPAVGAAAFRPASGPGTAPWYGQWANLLRGLDPFEGTVLEVRLDGIAIPMGRLSNAERLRGFWTRESLRFEARVRTGPIPHRRALVATIAESQAGWPAAIWQDGTDATMSLRTAASDLALRSPALRLTGAFDQPEGSELLLSIEARGGALLARAEKESQVRETRMVLRPASAWITLWPWSTAFRGEPAVRTAVWLLAFGGLTGIFLGYCMRSGEYVWFGTGLGASIPVLTHAVIPWLTGVPRGTVTDWGLTIVATGAGIALGSLISRNRLFLGKRLVWQGRHTWSNDRGGPI
jgi:hypothetical protein